MTKENMKHEELDDFCSKNYKRAKYFYENKIPVHIVKTNGTFFNGYILKLNSNIIEIHDREIGLEKVFFFDIKKDIVEFVDDKKGVKKDANNKL